MRSVGAQCGEQSCVPIVAITGDGGFGQYLAELNTAVKDHIPITHVLLHNEGQNMALAAARFQAPRLLHVHARYLRQLLRENRVSLESDGLPDEKEIAARRSAGTGLTTPELAVLLAHTKIAAGQQVLASDLPDDPSLRSTLAGYFPGANALVGALCPACEQQSAGSAFLTKLNAGGETSPGVDYTVIESANDEVVTPYTSAFLSGRNVTNILLQSQCALDQGEHLSMPYDHIADADVLTALDPAQPQQPACTPVLPVIGG